MQNAWLDFLFDVFAEVYYAVMFDIVTSFEQFFDGIEIFN